MSVISSSNLSSGAEFDPFEYDLTYGSITEAGVVPWRAANNGTGAGVANYTAVLFAGHPGVARHQTGTDTTGYAVLHGQEQVIGPGCVFKACIRIEDLSTASEEFKIFVGYTNSLNGTDPVTGIYFSYVRGSSVNWRCHTMAASTETVTASSVAVAADAWVDLELQLNAARTSATFYINGTLVATHTTNIQPNTDYCYPMTKIVKTAGTTDRIIYTDFIYDKLFKD